MKFNKLYENYLDEASVLDPVKPSKIKHTTSGQNKITSFNTPAGNNISVIFNEYPNNEAELSFKVNDETKTDKDPKRAYDKDIVRMVLWVVKEELEKHKYSEIAVLPEFDKNDYDGLKRKKGFIRMIKRYITNYKVIDMDEEYPDFTLELKDDDK